VLFPKYIDFAVAKCKSNILYGNLEDDCQCYPGETCNFTCDAEYFATIAPAVICQKNSTWNYDL